MFSTGFRCFKIPESQLIQNCLDGESEDKLLVSRKDVLGYLEGYQVNNRANIQ